MRQSTWSIISYSIYPVTQHMIYDFACRSTIRDKIIPHAVSWFTGEAAQDDEFEDMEDDDDEDDDEEGDEDEEEDEDEDDEEGEDDVRNRKKVYSQVLLLE